MLVVFALFETLWHLHKQGIKLLPCYLVIFVSFSLTFIEVGCMGPFLINQKIKKNQKNQRV